MGGDLTRIPLSDKILTDIANGSLDPSIVIDVQIGVAMPLSLRREGNTGWFKIGELRKDVPIEIPVRIENEEAVFFPGRSARHREILRALGKE